MKIKMVTNNYKTVPEGKRRLKITKSECVPSGSPKKWELSFQDSEGGFINNSFDLRNDKSLFAMAKFVEKVLGIKAGEEFDTTTDPKKCLNLEIYAEVKHTEGNKLDDDGKPIIFANIDNRTVELIKEDTEEASPRNMISASDDLDI